MFMKKQNKKRGFTVTELVVVISVIAILSAVLIPTFTGIINNSRRSADEQAVAGMNKILATEEKFDDVDDVINYLIENEYADNLTTYYSKHKLACVFEGGKTAIVLVEGNEVVYPKSYKGKAFEELTRLANNADGLQNGLTDGQIVYVGDDITAKDGLSTTAAGTYEVDLSGKTLSAKDIVGSWVENSKLVVSNGTINASASNESIAVYAAVGGYVELTDVQVLNTGASKNSIQCFGGTMVLNNVTTAQAGAVEGKESWYKSAIQIANHIVQDQDGKWYFDGAMSYITVNGGIYSGDKAIQMSAPGGVLVINDGVFMGATAVINADYNATYAGQGAKYEITINGGTFTGAVKINNANIKCVVNGGTFSVDIGKVANVKIGTGKTVVDNGNGTWTVR